MPGRPSLGKHACPNIATTSNIEALRVGKLFFKQQEILNIFPGEIWGEQFVPFLVMTPAQCGQSPLVFFNLVGLQNLLSQVYIYLGIYLLHLVPRPLMAIGHLKVVYIKR